MAELSALDRAIRAARRGRPDARQLLSAVLEDEPRNELAIVWRARVEDEPDIKAHYLRRVLSVNPGSPWATAQLAALEGKAPPSRTLDLDEIGVRKASIHHLQCASCAGQIEVHPERGSKVAACTQCGTVLDLTTKQLEIIGQVTTRWIASRDIRPGAEAVLEGERHVVNGWLRYEGWDSEERWRWDEWQLVSDSGAVRYLSFSDDEGFLLQTPVRPTPKVTSKGIEFADGFVRFYEGSAARIVAMAGELTWRPRLEDVLRVAEARRDGIQYSVETTADEIEVVGGHGMSEVEVWKALGREDQVEHVRARLRELGRLQRLLFQVAALSVVLGIAFSILYNIDLPLSNVTSADLEYTIVPTVLPEDRDERSLALYDTLEVMTVDLSSRVYGLGIEYPSPVDPPRQFEVDLAWMDKTDGRFQREITFGPRVPAGTIEQSTNDYVTVDEPGTYTLVALVQREWGLYDFEGYSEGDKQWRRTIDVPMTVTLLVGWSPDPFLWGAWFFFMLSLTALSFGFWQRARTKRFGSV